MDSTAFVLVTDKNYSDKAKRTILDLRTKGKWNGDIVLISIDFNLNQNFKDYYNIINVSFPQINKSNLLQKIGNGFSNSDKREINKLNQWEKLHVFDDYFKKWNRIVFMDAGLRVFDSVEHLLSLDYKNTILAPDDGGHFEITHKLFKYQLSHDNPDLINKVKSDFGDIFERRYFLNCIWIYDTKILDICNKQELIDAMNTYTCCKTNEMAIMNLLLHFKHRLWRPFPQYNIDDKYLFDWSESCNSQPTTWRNYCYMKYPVSIGVNDYLY